MFLVNGSQALSVNRGCFKCNSVINLSLVNKNLFMVLFILNLSFQILLKLLSYLFLIKVDFFLPQTAQFDKNINLFCLAFLTLEISFVVFFVNWSNRFPMFSFNIFQRSFYFYLSSHYIFLIHYLLKQIRYE